MTPGLKGKRFIHYTTVAPVYRTIYSPTDNFEFGYPNSNALVKFYLKKGMKMYCSKTCVNRPLKNRQNKDLNGG